MDYTFKVLKDEEMFSNNDNDTIRKKIIERHKSLLKKKVKEMREKNKKSLKEMTISIISVDDTVPAISDIVSFIIARKPNINVSSDIIANALISAIDSAFADDTAKKKQFFKRLLRFLIGYYKTM